MSNTKMIVIAEDDPYLREAYMRRFHRTDFIIHTAENGIQAVQMLKEAPPDLLICDIMMPLKDGWGVLEQFPKESRTFPVIMLTNLEDEKTRKRCAELGADDYFVKKDMSLHSLVEMAEKLLEKKFKK